MAGTSWPSLVAGKKAKSSEVELKFDWIEGNLVPMNAGEQTNNAYDLGTSAYRWKTVYAMDLNLGGSNTAGGIISGTSASNAIKLATGAAVNEFSTDATMADSSDLAVPTEKAVKTYIDSYYAPSTISVYNPADCGSYMTTVTVNTRTTGRVLVMAHFTGQYYADGSGGIVIYSALGTSPYTDASWITGGGQVFRITGLGVSSTIQIPFSLMTVHTPGTTTVTYGVSTYANGGSLATITSYNLIAIPL